MKRSVAVGLLLGALVSLPALAADPAALPATNGPLDAIPPWLWLCAVGVATGAGMAGGWFARGPGSSATRSATPNATPNPTARPSAPVAGSPPPPHPNSTSHTTRPPARAPLPGGSPTPAAPEAYPWKASAPSPFPSGRAPTSPFARPDLPEPADTAPAPASEAPMPIQDPPQDPTTGEPTSAPEALLPPRAGQGPHAPVLTRLDQAFRLFERGVSDPSLHQRFPDVEHSVAQFNYFHELLLQLSDHGSTQYTTSFGDTIDVTTFEQWLDLFATAVLDPFSIRCTDLLIAGLDGDGLAQLLGDVFRDLLQYQVAEALREAGYAPVQAFPLSGGAPQPATMRVVGSAGRPALTGQIVGLHQYGLVKGRTLVRQAHVTTG